MKKFLIFTLITFCGLDTFGQAAGKTIKIQSPPKAETKTSPISKITAEEYKVYMAALGENREPFVIRDKSDMDKESKNIDRYSVREFLKELIPETIEDFQAKNKETAQLKKKFPTNINYTLIKIDELKEFFAYEFDGEMDWEAFYKKYPKSGGLYTFSRVGFSQNGQQALLFVTNWCRSLCGEGNYYLLKKENGEWKVINKHMVWIS